MGFLIAILTVLSMRVSELTVGTFEASTPTGLKALGLPCSREISVKVATDALILLFCKSSCRCCR